MSIVFLLLMMRGHPDDDYDDNGKPLPGTFDAWRYWVAREVAPGFDRLMQRISPILLVFSSMALLYCGTYICMANVLKFEDQRMDGFEFQMCQMCHFDNHKLYRPHATLERQLQCCDVCIADIEFQVDILNKYFHIWRKEPDARWLLPKDFDPIKAEAKREHWRVLGIQAKALRDKAQKTGKFEGAYTSIAVHAHDGK